MFKRIVETKYRDLTIGGTVIPAVPNTANSWLKIIQSCITVQGVDYNNVIGRTIFVRKIVFSLQFYRVDNQSSVNPDPNDGMRFSIIKPYNMTQFSLPNASSLIPKDIYTPWATNVGKIVMDKRFNLGDFFDVAGGATDSLNFAKSTRKLIKVIKVNRNFRMIQNIGLAFDTDTDYFMIVWSKFANCYGFEGNIRVTYMDA